MAVKRMISKKIVDTDAFLDMPLSSQALYFHLLLRADDDGFMGNHKRIMRTIGCSEDDMKILLGKRFIIPFESGVCVIKHWLIHNTLRHDRYTPTTYQEEMNQIGVKENKSYTLDFTQIGNGNQMVPQKRIGLEEKSEDKVNKEKKEPYFSNPDLNNLFNDFLKQRKKLKAINSDRAINGLLNKLEPFEDKIKTIMINESIINSWKGLFELKKDKLIHYKKLLPKDIESDWLDDYIKNIDNPNDDYNDTDSLDKVLGIGKYEKER